LAFCEGFITFAAKITHYLFMEEKILTDGEEKKSLSFVEQFVKEDLEAGKNGGRIQTRFPPEPNGYIHIGHAKAICMDFGVAEEFGGICNLRFDDTNPTKENTEYVENIMSDIKWLGFHWENVYYASDYFEKLWDFAVWLIKKGLAYVDEQTSEQIAEQKGTPTQPGRPSPFRDRPIEENLRLFEQMNTAEAVEGSMVLRAKLDMANPNMHFRDPIIYRIIQIPHHRTGTKWHAYPMYDFAHGQSDYFEGVTHSICTLEFVPHRPLYDKFVDLLREYIKEQTDTTGFNPDILNKYDGTRQIEFNRLNLTYTVMSKRKLKALVDENLVNGWDDPRMPTVCGMRRRGYSSQSVRNFIDSIGYTKFDALNDYALLEASVRDDLNKKATRVSAVLDPVKLVLTNYPEGKTEEMEAVNNPENEADGTHKITFSRELWIERDDFMEVAEKKFQRLAPGKEVRLKNAYIIKCDEEHPCDKDANGNVTTIYATYDPETRSGQPGADRKIKGKTLHWVNCQDAVQAEVRLYDRLFAIENPGADERDFRELLNPQSLTVLNNSVVEPYLKEKKAGDFLQFQRIGYFTLDLDATPNHLVFNKTVGLKDTWKR
jgi:glutaminyl-tRNA synthetase